MLTISVPAALYRAGKVFGDRRHGRPGAPQCPDPILIRAIVRAYRFNEKLVQGKVRKFGDLAQSEKLHRFYLTQLLRLAYLAPDIIAAILDGKQPARLTATQLIEHPNLPLGWPETTLLMKSQPGLPMTLGNAAAASVRLIVWALTGTAAS